MTTNETKTFLTVKNVLKQTIKQSHAAYFKAIISIEHNIDNPKLLDQIYDIYMQNDNITLTNPIFDDLITQLS